MDWNCFTLMDWKRKHQTFVDRCFAASRRWVFVMDSAVFGNAKFQRNRDAYARDFGMDPTDWRDYYRVVAEVHKERYGFGLVKAEVIFSRCFAFLLFRRGAPIDYKLQERSAKAPVHLRYLGTTDHNGQPITVAKPTKQKTNRVAAESSSDDRRAALDQPLALIEEWVEREIGG
jgi:hypothetical protein